MYEDEHVFQAATPLSKVRLPRDLKRLFLVDYGVTCTDPAAGQYANVVDFFFF